MRSPSVGRHAVAAAALLTLAGCGGASYGAASSAPSSAAGPGNSGSASSSSGVAAPTVRTASVSGHGLVLVAANGMTLYQFAEDRAGSGTSACASGCISRWPALTVSAGTTPAAVSGVTGTLATITRSDSGATQVIYNGRPVYFFSGDSKPGDSNGNYPGWSVVAAASGAGGSGSTGGAGTAPAATPSSGY